MNYTLPLSLLASLLFLGCGSSDSQTTPITQSGLMVETVITASTDTYVTETVALSSSVISGLIDDFGGDTQVNASVTRSIVGTSILNNETVSVVDTTTTFELSSSSITDKNATVTITDYISNQGYLKEERINYPTYDSLLNDVNASYGLLICTSNSELNLGQTGSYSLTCNSETATLDISIAESSAEVGSGEYLNCQYTKTTSFDVGYLSYIYKECISRDGEVTSSEYESIDLIPL